MGEKRIPYCAACSSVYSSLDAETSRNTLLVLSNRSLTLKRHCRILGDRGKIKCSKKRSQLNVYVGRKSMCFIV